MASLLFDSNSLIYLKVPRKVFKGRELNMSLFQWKFNFAAMTFSNISLSVKVWKIFFQIL